MCTDSDSSQGGTAAKQMRTGGMFPCPYCSYTSDKRAGLTRHVRIHYPSKDEQRAQSGSPPKERVPLTDMFCHECNIQFTSMSTFSGHKEFYCEMRRRNVPKGGKESRGSNSSSPHAVASVVPTKMKEDPPREIPPAVMPLPGHPLMLSAGGVPGGPLMVSSASGALVMTTPVMMTSQLGSLAFNMPVVVQSLPQVLRADGLSHATQVSAAVAAAAASTSVSTKLPPAKTPPQVPPPASVEQPLDLTVKKKLPSVVIERPVSQAPTSETYSDRINENKEEPQDLSIKSETSSPRCSTRSCSPQLRRDISPIVSPVTPKPTVTQMTHPQMSPPAAGVSRCLECNIVFYKLENYLIHKQHYCSGKPVSNLRTEEENLMDPRKMVLPHPMMPMIPLHHSMPHLLENSLLAKAAAMAAKSPAMKTSPVEALTPPTSTPSEPVSAHCTPELYPVDQLFLQFYCTSCKIKFSSRDTLNAHKKYYCPSGENAKTTRDNTPPVPTKSSSPEQNESEDESGGNHSCVVCGNSYLSARLLRLHFCTGSSMHIPLFRCPYCDYIAQTDNRLVEHIKAHAPSKAYRCTICGYRGNTVRGMRMHGKMHIDAGESFTDENMLEYEEPPAIPKKFRSSADQSPLDIEAELLRLKNEPYKRRRSRKAHEKSENQPLRRQSPSERLDSTETISEQYHKSMRAACQPEESVFPCKACDFTCSDSSSLLYHMKMEHEISTTNDREGGHTGPPDNHEGGHASSPDNHNRTTQSTKAEPHTNSHIESPRPIIIEPVNVYAGDTVKVEKGHSPMAIDPPAHLSKSEHVTRDVSPMMNGDAEKHPPPEHSTVNGRCVASPCTSPEQEERATSSPRQSSTSGGARCTPTPPSHSPLPSPLVPPPSQTASPPPPTLTTVTSDPLDTVEYMEAAHLAVLQKKMARVKYCDQCDISFKYLSSFMAHKKYYCNSHAGERTVAQTEV